MSDFTRRFIYTFEESGLDALLSRMERLEKLSDGVAASSARLASGINASTDALRAMSAQASEANAQLRQLQQAMSAVKSVGNIRIISPSSSAQRSGEAVSSRTVSDVTPAAVRQAPPAGNQLSLFPPQGPQQLSMRLPGPNGTSAPYVTTPRFIGQSYSSVTSPPIPISYNPPPTMYSPRTMSRASAPVMSGGLDLSSLYGTGMKTGPMGPEPLSRFFSAIKNESPAVRGLTNELATMGHTLGIVFRAWASWQVIDVAVQAMQRWLDVQIEVNDQMVNFQMMTGRGPEEAAAFMEQSQALSRKTGLKPSEAMETLLITERLDQDPIIAERALQLERVSGLQSTSAAQSIIGLGFQFPDQDISSTLDQAVGAYRKGAISSYAEFFSMLDAAGPTATQFHTSPAGLFSLIAGASVVTPQMSSQSIETGVNRISQQYEDPNSRFRLNIENAGISTMNKDGSSRDFINVLNDLGKSYQAGNISADQMRVITEEIPNEMGAKHRELFVSLISGFEEVNAAYDSAQSSQGAFVETFETSMEKISSKTDELAAAADRFLEAVGDSGSLSAVLDGLTTFISFLADIYAKGNFKVDPDLAGPDKAASGIGQIVGRNTLMSPVVSAAYQPVRGLANQAFDAYSEMFPQTALKARAYAGIGGIAAKNAWWGATEKLSENTPEWLQGVGSFYGNYWAGAAGINLPGERPGPTSLPIPQGWAGQPPSRWQMDQINGSDVAPPRVASSTPFPDQTYTVGGGQDWAAIESEYTRLMGTFTAAGFDMSGQMTDNVLVLDEFGVVVDQGAFAMDILGMAASNAAGSLGNLSSVLGSQMILSEFQTPTSVTAQYETTIAELNKNGLYDQKNAELKTYIMYDSKGELLGTEQYDPEALSFAQSRLGIQDQSTREGIAEGERVARQADAEQKKLEQEQVSYLRDIRNYMEGFASRLMSPTAVTEADMGRSKLGTYTDKFDEPVRRMQANVDARLNNKDAPYPEELARAQELGYFGDLKNLTGDPESMRQVSSAWMEDYSNAFYNYELPSSSYNMATAVNEYKKEQERETNKGKFVDDLIGSLQSAADLGMIENFDPVSVRQKYEGTEFTNMLFGGKTPEKMKEELGSYGTAIEESLGQGIKNSLKDGDYVAYIVQGLGDQVSQESNQKLLIAQGQSIGVYVIDGMGTSIKDKLLPAVISAIMGALAAGQPAS